MSLKHARRWLWCGLSLVLCVAFLFPIYWMFSASLKTDTEIFTLPATLLPQSPSLDNYAEIFTNQGNVGRSFLNSFINATLSMAFSVLLSIPASYSLARFRLKGKKPMLLLFLVAQMLPPTLTLTPLFIMFSNVKLTNNILSVVLACAASSVPFSIMIMRPFFLSVPKELEEAAMIDGCSRVGTFAKIILPVSYTGVITVAVFAFVGGWNNLVYPMTFIQNSSTWPATAGLYAYNNEYGLQWNMVMTYAMLLMVPLLLLFIFLQKYMVPGMADGAVKG
ncbi:MAG: carbohydrate ABC transporter permease [Eubacteriales bacterium]|nr:carbohydrate ABC transporter permease [Eubacteriales bacterium]